MASGIVQAFNGLSKTHKIVLSTLTVATMAVAIWRPVHIPTSHERDSSPDTIIPLSQSTIETEGDDLIQDSSEQLPDEGVADTDTDASDADATPLAHEYVVSSGDNLSSILTQFGIEAGDVATLSNQHKSLRNLKIGQTLSWTLNADGELESLTWDVSRRETRIFNRVGATNKFEEVKEIRKGDWSNTVMTGSIDGTFAQSTKKAGLTRTEGREVTKALQWQVDFNKLKKGDKFTVLMGREMLNGTHEQSQLVGVRLQSGGKNYYAFRAEDGRYYDSEGNGLERGFLRFPTVKQFRVSSHFNPRRVNPVTGRVAPHKGVDFSMPVGTPVLAVGDGEVIVAKYSGAAGNFIAIRHGRQYTTRYMHLRQLLVKPGQKVKRGDRIALSGNTGRSTGPHLHFEMWVNQQAVNPLTAKLPSSGGLTGKERKEYLELVKETKPQLKLK
ncbi:TPA: murein DD-endopeptidase MepM [Providencia alcalifaciens]|uniref:Murein DD-endopeptidase MepM n=2 Tax=Providencia alcalifaciens TaxID=126385 RepID=A0AAW9V6B6_9GAMM|nr:MULTISPECIES: murein DD-endopeptidase MepM [Providencia]MBF0690265.1 murein DD-endopeptidase MepM [Providencia alcalifaciens]MTC17005.1 murein DD-endopeptidase MepM [Providencia alcalifaciens]MTC32218.1 murein DD-endopeptidase MepM [Providencia alcalifaciens]MTC33208.1 murein DD-endopeptidase MepM [Providencia alcalifaciens]MTC51481.1 murein DD-endopeptidase MepM [Providencia alcalifaciens]